MIVNKMARLEIHVGDEGGLLLRIGNLVLGEGIDKGWSSLRCRRALIVTGSASSYAWIDLKKLVGCQGCASGDRGGGGTKGANGGEEDRLCGGHDCGGLLIRRQRQAEQGLSKRRIVE